MTDRSETYDEDHYLSLTTESGKIAGITRLLKQGNEIVCEIGCAAGHFLATMANHIGHGTGIDTADAAIRAATQIKDKHDLQKIDFMQISAQEYAAAPDRRNQSMNIVPQLEDHIAIRNQTQYVQLLKQAGFKAGRLFASRLFVVARKK
jgi:2-polyprenyl-3-methyl-5-hydroxy-6-metoxy-1,4-benzoquinol methylase